MSGLLAMEQAAVENQQETHLPTITLWLAFTDPAALERLRASGSTRPFDFPEELLRLRHPPPQETAWLMV